MKNENLEYLFNDLLESEEKIIWMDQPRQGLFFTTQDFFLLPFSMFGCGLAYFLIITPSIIDVPQTITIFGWIVMALSLYFFLFRFVVDSNYRSKIYYCLTDEKVIIKIGSKSKIINFKIIPLFKLDANVDGTGSLWFVEQSTIQLLLGNSLNGLPFYKHPEAILFITDVKRIYSKILELKQYST
jgi:hypothetical protein